MRQEYTGQVLSPSDILRAWRGWAGLGALTTCIIVKHAHDTTAEAIARCSWLSSGTSARSGRGTLVPRSEPYKGPASMNWWGEN